MNPEQAEEDRLLRVWTPVLLRTVLITSMLILVVGMALMVTKEPGYYLERYRLAQGGRFHQRETLAQIVSEALAGDPHSVLTVGLLVLTLVPLGRVAFCFLLFLKEGDYAYVTFTAYVLIGLAAGVVLGRIG